MNEYGQTADNVVFIICNEQARYIAWAQILLKAGSECVYAICAGGMGYKINKENVDEGGDLITRDELPSFATTVLIHSGDGSLWDKNMKTNRVFWFDSPGSPAVSGGDLPILRATSASTFDVTETDAQEIIAYSAGKRIERPSCCLPKSARQYLPSLAILCQGYLVVHAEYDEHTCKVGPSEAVAALNQMGFNEAGLVRSIGDIGKARMEAYSSVVEYWLKPFDLLKETTNDVSVEQTEWARFDKDILTELAPETYAENSSIAALLDALKTGSKVPSLAIVAEAYCQIVRRLGGRPCVP